jgi:PAS domain S-box-containing protein
MSDPSNPGVDNTVLVLAPIGRDAEAARVLLRRDGIDCRICPDLDALCAAISAGPGAVLVTDEALVPADLRPLSEQLQRQPPWSDLPFIVLTRSDREARRAVIEKHLPATLSNMILLERPLHAVTLSSAVRSALRGRSRQRQIGTHLAEQRAAAAALLESEARFRNMADSAPALIWMTDANGHVSFLNEHHYYLLGPWVRDVLGKFWAELVDPADQAQHAAAFSTAFTTRTPFRIESRVADKTGLKRWVRCDGVARLDDHGGFLGYTCCSVDITEARLAADELEQRVTRRTVELSQALEQLKGEVRERTRVEEALRQAQKMEAIGQLSGGIAHDFNNMLQAIASYLDLLDVRFRRALPPEAVSLIGEANKTVERAATLTHRLLAFGRLQALKPVSVRPDELVHGFADLIRLTVGAHVDIQLNLSPGIWTIRCDPNQLDNVLLNLAINARDAMPGGGQIVISVTNMRLTAAEIAGHEGVQAGDFVEITVADNGIGMTPDVLARAFEPFFTTKPVGQGTGLGLSQIHGFIRQSNGLVRLESEPGRGTSVRLYLPREAAAELTSNGVSASPIAAPAEGTVLLVEDDASMRVLVAEVIRELGCRVVEAADGPAGLRTLQSDDEVDLLVTDVSLPGLNGRQLAEAGRELRPSLPILLITGFAGSPAAEWDLGPGVEVIGKPFRMNKLVSCVTAMLAGTADGRRISPVA